MFKIFTSHSIHERVSDFRKRLSFEPLHSLDGKKGWIEAVDHFHDKENPPKHTHGRIVWSEEKKCYELRRDTKGIVIDGIFVSNKGQEVQYVIAVNELFIKEFKVIK